MSAHQKLTPQTTTQRTAAHRRRMAEKMARQTVALEAIAALEDSTGTGDYDYGYDAAIYKAVQIAEEALKPTDPAKS